jgi:subtilisin family serine protease
MRATAHAAAAWLAMLAAGAAAGATPPEGATPASVSPPPRIVVAFANRPHGAPGPAGTTGSRYEGQGYRVAQTAQQQVRRVAAAYALREIASWPIKALAMHCVVFEITDGRPLGEVLSALSHDDRVLLAQPLQEFHTLTDAHPAGVSYNDPLYDLQTNLTALGIARAQERSQGAGIRVALIDTGVDGAHPDLAGRVRATHSYLSTPPRSAAWLRHGTAMAGLIAAVANNHIGIVGIAPLAQLEIYEACWQQQADRDAAACNTFTLAQALAGALASGAPLVNLSFAGPADPLLSALVQAGLKRGVTFVGAAAGPEAPFPAGIPGVIAAGSTAGPAAPGAFALPAEHVLTLRPAGQYDFESGTSVAAAELSGLFALLMSAAPARQSGPRIAELLRDTMQISSAAADVPQIDVNAALARLDALRESHLAARGAH